MSRTRKSAKRKARQHPAKVAAAGNTQAVETQAAASLSAARFKDAIVGYKALVKEERRAPWVAGLDQAYAGRAAELANKGMFNEALTIWEQRATSCNTERSTPTTVLWQLQAGRIEPALGQYHALSGKLPAGELALLREYLAAAALGGETRIVASLSADDPVARDQPVAESLLMAFCNANEAGVDMALKGISHRSPFRDFRQVIKAWRAGEQTSADVPAALSRLPRQSPFRGLADTLLELHSGENVVIAAMQADSNTLSLQTALQGWSGKQVELLKAAAALGPEPNAKALFNLLVRFAKAFDPEDARALALKLLVHYPHGQHGFARAFGKLSDLEEATLTAQVEELNGEPPGPESSWRDVVFELDGFASNEASNVDQLESSKESSPGLSSASSSQSSSASASGDNSLRAALVLRRLATRILDYQDDPYTRSIAIDDLEESLALDADCVTSHVRLIELLRQSNQLKVARQRLDQALEHFPAHTGVLLEAVQTAIAGKAFKKAARLARRLLKIDPINLKVQALLLDAHMSHARKQIASGKYDLARRELDEAATWSRSSESEGQVLLLRGMLECETGGTARGRTLLQQGVELSGGALVGQFRLLIEGERLQEWSGKEWLATARLPKPAKFASRESILALVRAVADTREASTDLLAEALEPFEPALRKACKEPFSQAEMLQVCETLHRVEQFEMLGRYAAQARRHWPDRAVFGFHYLYARCEGWCHELEPRDLDELDRIMEAAHSEGDDRTLHRLMEFVYPPDPLGRMPDSYPGEMSGGFPFGMPPDFPQELEPAFAGDMPPGIPAALAKLLEELGPEGAEALLDSLENGTGNPFTGTSLDSILLPGGDDRQPKPDAGSGRPGKSGSKHGASSRTGAGKAETQKSGAKKPIPNSDQGELF